jgi:hypothetical protein
MTRYYSFLILSGFFVALAGCGSEGAGLLGVKGTVNFEGKPLARGSINFELEDRTNPFHSGAAIEDGKFAIPQARGLKPGTYLVRISSADSAPTDSSQPPGEPLIAKELIPTSWNSESKQKVEVKAGATDLKFDVK